MTSSVNNTNSGNAISNEEFQSVLTKIKDNALRERSSYDIYFGSINDTLNEMRFDKENHSIQYNLGLANQACHVQGDRNTIGKMLEDIKNNPEVQQHIPKREEDLTGLYIYGIEANLNHHKNIEEIEWLKNKAPFSSPGRWSKQFIYKFLRPYFGVQNIFNENLVKFIDVLIDAQIQNRTSMIKMGEDIQNFTTSVVRCLNEWVQKDLKKESQSVEYLSSLLATQFQFVKSEIETLRKTVHAEGEGVRAELNELKDIFGKFNDEKNSIYQKLSESLKSESMGVRSEIDDMKKSVFSTMDDMGKHIHKVTEDVSGSLRENFISTLTTESKGIREEIFKALDEKNAQMKKELEEVIISKVSDGLSQVNDLVGKISAGSSPVSGGVKSSADVSSQNANITAESEGFDFHGFEEWSRGSEEFVSEEQKVYVPYLSSQKRVLDLGCGRGEFLDILKKNGIPAYGIDIDPKMVLHCVKKGLEVKLDNLISHLETIEPGSVDTIFAAQVVEHLTISQINKMMSLAYEKLASGGKIILETINPCCLSTFSGALYADPTHQKPVHPVALQFFMEKAGFGACQTIYSVKIPESHKLELLGVDSKDDLNKELINKCNENFAKLNSLLYTFAHYAILAEKKE